LNSFNKMGIIDLVKEEETGFKIESEGVDGVLFKYD